MSRAERDLVASHLLFAVAAAAVLAAPSDVAVGVRVAVLVGLYNVGLVALGVARGHREWLRIASFVIPLSVFQVVPDWFLSSQLGVLRFPPDGLADIGTVTAYMAGLWTIPLFLVVAIGRSAEARQGRGPAYLAALFVTAALFLPAEAAAHRLPAWEAVGVDTVGAIAVYIVPAELLLGLVAYGAYLAVRERNVLVRVVAAFLVMVFYLGAAVTSWFLLEQAHLRLVTTGA